jgi:hypothetical protein
MPVAEGEAPGQPVRGRSASCEPSRRLPGRCGAGPVGPSSAAWRSRPRDPWRCEPASRPVCSCREERRVRACRKPTRVRPCGGHGSGVHLPVDCGNGRGAASRGGCAIPAAGPGTEAPRDAPRKIVNAHQLCAQGVRWPSPVRHMVADVGRRAWAAAGCGGGMRRGRPCRAALSNAAGRYTVRLGLGHRKSPRGVRAPTSLFAGPALRTCAHRPDTCRDGRLFRPSGGAFSLYA